jgi:lipoyl(octanoyl) transferase
LQQAGIEVAETDRGGDVTYHGPGQLIGYPIVDLSKIRRDVVWYVRSLEEAIIRTAQDLGIAAARVKGCPGVWVGNAKVAALGIHISRWITSHGFALNLETDLSYYRHIVPCGIASCPITSFRQVLGKPVDRSVVESLLARHFAEVFGLEARWVVPDRLEKEAPCPPMS